MELSSWLAREKGKLLLELSSLDDRPVLTTHERARVESLEQRIVVLDAQIDETIRDNHQRRNHG